MGFHIDKRKIFSQESDMAYITGIAWLILKHIDFVLEPDTVLKCGALSALPMGT
jgi:hypothetical protein